MYILYAVTLKVAEGLFNQSNAEYICSKSHKKEKNVTTEYLSGSLFKDGCLQVIKCMNFSQNRVEQTAMNYLVTIGDLNFRKL